MEKEKIKLKKSEEKGKIQKSFLHALPALG